MSNEIVADTLETLMQFLYRAPIGLVESSLNGDIEMLNPMATRLLMPLSPDGNLDNLFRVLDSAAPQLRSLAAEFPDPSGTICEALRLPVRSSVHQESQVLSVSLLKLNTARIMMVVTDATLEVEREQRALDRQLHDATHTDELTRLPNRTAAVERIQALLESGSAGDENSFAVLYINCDRFRQINDTHGRSAGDQVLGMMAERLQAALRMRPRTGRHGDMQPMAARVGGDEFAVVLDDLTRAEDARTVAQRLLDVLSAPYSVDTYQFACSLSMGIVLAADLADGAVSTLQNASLAMAEAKQLGGARFAVFEHAMQERAARRGETENELRRALREGELFVVYQPVVGYQESGAIDRTASAEALVRWHHPTRGTVPPLEFIQVAEDCGMIGAIGTFVLETACRDLARWRQQLGPRAPRSVSVNLSRAQLRQPGYVESVQDILRMAHLPAACLQLEITESLAAQDRFVQAQLQALKSLGIRLALDDFGTGYSSLSSLHELAVDTVKIDRSFVSQSDTSLHHRVLIDATVRVANSLGMRTIAEGIETEAQDRVVRSLGCDLGQGFLYSVPLEPSDFEAWLRG